MNKLLKGSIAGAAGVALLLGGAGTFAYWNSSATLAGDTIVSGNLAVTDSADPGVWTVNGGTTAIVLAGYLVAPGDVLTYTKTMTINASGDNLVATLDLSPTSIVAANGTPADIELARLLDDSAVLDAAGTGIVDNLDNTFTITPAAGEVAQDVTVVASIAFPSAGAGAENAAMMGSVNLSALALTLTQVVPTAPAAPVV